jgi:hypothetical protein
MVNEITSDPFAPGADAYARERCSICGEVLYPHEQVRYHLVGERSPVFCVGCHVVDFVEAGAGEPGESDSDGVPQAVGGEAETRPEAMTTAEVAAYWTGVIEGRRAA